jgi:hypothetical protein
MTTRSMQLLNPPSNLECSLTLPPRKPVSLREEQSNPAADRQRSQHSEALRHLKQTYSLERRYFL